MVFTMYLIIFPLILMVVVFHENKRPITRLLRLLVYEVYIYSTSYIISKRYMHIRRLLRLFVFYL